MKNKFSTYKELTAKAVIYKREMCKFKVQVARTSGAIRANRTHSKFMF